MSDKSKKYTKYAIIAIIVVSFMFFGIYSTIMSRKSYVAKVDGTKISMQQFNNYLSKRRQQILMNVQDDPERQKQALTFIETSQFQNLALNEMVNEIIINKFLKSYNIHINPEIVAGYVKTMDVFQKDGKFDKAYFDQYLSYTGLNQHQFLKGQVPEIEQQIFGYLLSPMQVPQNTLAAEYTKALGMTRNVEVLTIKDPEPTIPSDDELQKFYETKKSQFIEKPKHYVKLLYIDDYIDKHSEIFQATPEAIEKYFNQNYSGKVVKMYFVEFDDESQANKVYEIAKKQGISLQSILETLLKKPINNVIKSGFISSDDIQEPEIISVAKEMKIGNVTPVIKVQKKFFIAQITDIQEERFVDVKHNEVIGEKISHERKCNNAGIYTAKLKEELQTGASFEAVALKYGLPISAKIMVNQETGQVADEQTNQPITINQKLLDHILDNTDTSYGYVININEKTCSYVVYKQERVTAERIKSLPEVRGEIIFMYNKEKILKQKLQVAESITGQVKSLKTSLSGYAIQGDFEQLTVTAKDVLGSKVLNHSVGDIFFDSTQDGKVYVMKIIAEKHFTESVNDEEVNNNSQNIANIYYNDFLQALIQDLQTKYKVERRTF